MGDRLNPIGVTRRELLRTVAAAGLAAAWPRRGRAAPAAWPTAVLPYLESLARPDGGYGWEDQERSHLTPTFAVIGCYRLLDQTPPHKVRLAAFVRTQHPSRLKRLEQEHRVFEWQQVQALTWLGEDASEFRGRIRGWKQPLAYLKQYEQHGYPVFRSEASVFRTRALVGLPLDELSPHFTDYLNARRRANGSFNNTPAADGSDGHVLNTWWGLQALHLLGRAEERTAQTVAWLRGCQLPSGGFTYQPQPEFGGVDDVAYTWAAVRALELLGAEPDRREACIAWLGSLANADGGFSDRPGWLSNPVATFYALDALAALGASDCLSGLRQRPRGPKQVLPADLRAFTIQLEAHGCGSPAEAVDLARGLRIHLWGAKNAQPGWLVRAQAVADQQQVPVKFFVSNEEYGTWVTVPGLGTYSHTSDIMAPAGADCGAPLSNQGVVSWHEFRRRRLGPLEKGRGRLIWQFGENEELVRLFLDDSLERGGYAAISTFHFGNPDFTNAEPFLLRWRGRIPYVALQDAHGSEPWWFADMTAGFRTVFLAAEPTWDAWLEALRRNWVVAIRHDTASGLQTWMHGGSREVLDAVRHRWRDWRWWDNPGIARPLVSLVVVRPEDRFEVARPQTGAVLRVRCAWENTTQGLPKRPITELVRLAIDGTDVTPTLTVTQGARRGATADHYYTYPLGQCARGPHTATAVVRLIESQVEQSRSIRFRT